MYKMFDYVVFVFIFFNCVIIVLERFDIDFGSIEWVFFSVFNYIFMVIFVVEMMVKVVVLGLFLGEYVYF